MHMQQRSMSLVTARKLGSLKPAHLMRAGLPAVLLKAHSESAMQIAKCR